MPRRMRRRGVSRRELLAREEEWAIMRDHRQRQLVESQQKHLELYAFLASDLEGSTPLAGDSPHAGEGRLSDSEWHAIDLQGRPLSPRPAVGKVPPSLSLPTIGASAPTALRADEWQLPRLPLLPAASSRSNPGLASPARQQISPASPAALAKAGRLRAAPLRAAPLRADSFSRGSFPSLAGTPSRRRSLPVAAALPRAHPAFSYPVRGDFSYPGSPGGGVSPAMPRAHWEAPLGADAPHGAEGAHERRPSLGNHDALRVSHDALRVSKAKRAASPYAASRAAQPLPPPRKPLSEGLQLVWADTFDYEGAPHAHRWEYQTDCNDWVHDDRHCEAQWYTDRLENACVRDGRLRIIARAERHRGCDFTSARLRTKHRGDWLYGRCEVRARLPPSKRGLWPAIWMLPTDEAFGPWPHSGEIDVMEHVGWEDEGTIHSAAHSAAHNPAVGSQRSRAKVVAGAHRGFHTYSCDWTEKRIVISVDNDPVLVVENSGRGSGEWPYSERFHLLLNIAVGGWAMRDGIDIDAFPVCMEIAHVKYFQEVPR